MNASVLLVDDDRALRKLIRAYLQEEGIAVLECGSGEEAVELARERHPSLVLLDVRLPGSTDSRCCAASRPPGSHSPSSCVTSLSDELDQLVGFRLGAVDYVTKPVSPEAARGEGQVVHDPRLGPRGRAPAHGGGGRSWSSTTPTACSSAGREVALTRREFDLLAALAEHPGWVYDRDHLLLGVWGYRGGRRDARRRPARRQPAPQARGGRRAGAAGDRARRRLPPRSRAILTLPRHSPHGIWTRPL